MSVRAYASRAKSWVKRTYMGRIDKVEDIRRRRKDFDEVRDEIRQSGTDELAYFLNGYTFEGGLSLQQNPDEFAALCLLLKERGPFENYMEIGSASGGTCLFLHHAVGFKNVLSLDDGNHRRAPEQKKNFAQIPNLKQFVGDSHTDDARRFLAENLRGKLDVAFIDGDHSYEGVWQDLQLTLPFCRRGTLVIFHDTVACDGVRDAWQRAIDERLIRPVANFVGEEKPLGIGVGVVV